MKLDNKIALSAHYKNSGLNNAQTATLLRVDASSVSRYLKQAEENNWLEQKVQLRLPRELEQAVQATVRAVELEEQLFQLFSEMPRPARAPLRREGFVVVKAVDRDKGEQARGKRGRTSAEQIDALVMWMMSIEGGRLLLDLLSQREREQPTTLGIAWGRGTGGVVSSLAKMSLPEMPQLAVVPLQGGVGRSVSVEVGSEYYPDILAERLSLLFRSRRTPALITLPAYISAATAADVKQAGLRAIWQFIESDPSFQQASLAYQDLDLALVGIGGLEAGAWALSSGYLTHAGILTALKREGACGDIVCRFLRSQAEDPIEGWSRSSNTETIRQTNLRAIGISLAALRARVRAGARVLAIAGGKSGAKSRAIHAAVRNGFVTDLVTDEESARAILREETTGK